MLDLKPCPFCGEDAKIAPDEIGSGGQHVPPYHAGCFRGSGCGFAFTADDPDEAIAAWNRRHTTTPPDVDGLVERLRKEASFLSVNRSWDDTDDLLIEAATALAAKDAELATIRANHQRYVGRVTIAEAALTTERAAHAETRRERDEAIKAAGDQATLRGEAEGKLAASEMAGIVDGWKRRAEAAEAQLAEARKALEQRDTDITEFMRRLGSLWFLEQGWFPASVECRDDDARRALTGGKNG